MPKISNIQAKLDAGILRKTTFYASSKVLDRLKMLAAYRGISMHQLIEQAIKDYLQAHAGEMHP